MTKHARLIAIGDKTALETMTADYYLQILLGRKIKLRIPEMHKLLDTLVSISEAEGKEELFWSALPDHTGEYYEFPLSKRVLGDEVIPERIFDAPGPGRPIELPGPIGNLCRAVGGVSLLAEMMECSVDAISQWAKGERQPSGPARVLMNRIAEEYSLPTIKWSTSKAPKDPE